MAHREFNDHDVKEYFKRCFFAVDGLWFVLLEKNTSFEQALELDNQVWQVLPKIQVRKIRELLGLGNRTLEDLRSALEFKFKAEEYEFEAKDTPGQLDINLIACPWLKLMKQSGREQLAAEIGKGICATEYQVWAEEFGVNFIRLLEDPLCQNGRFCLLRFQAQNAVPQKFD